MKKNNQEIEELISVYPADLLDGVDLVSAARKLLARDDGHYPICPDNFDPKVWAELLDKDSRTRASWAVNLLMEYVNLN